MANILSEIAALAPILRGVEAEIWAFIIKDPKKFTEYSLKDVASAASVSQGSVVNFANKYAGGGFPTLKLKIAEALSDYVKLEGNAKGEEGGVMEALVKNNAKKEKALRNTEILNSKENLLSAAELILAAKRVEIYGVFRSASVATDLCYQLLQLGIYASFVSDVLTSAVSAAMLDEKSLVIAISSSGKTKDVIDAVKIAKENGASVIAITSNKNAPLARIASTTLIAAMSGEGDSIMPNEIRTSQLAIIDALVDYLSGVIADGNHSYSRIKNILTSHNVEEH